jgi:hypothetical protein
MWRPVGGVTVLAQLTAGSFGTGWAYYAANIAVTVVLAVAANTSFGGLPVLMSLLSGDNRLPHLLGLRAERPVHRYGVIALAVLTGVLLIAVDAATVRLIPLYAIGVFIGFTISQTGLVRRWHGQRSPRWRQRAALNGAGAVLTATAAVVFIVSKFTSGAWVVVVTVPALMLLLSRIESYYQVVGRELGLGEHPHRPLRAKSRAPPSAPNGTAGTPACGWTPSTARTDHWSTRSSTTSGKHSKPTGRSPCSSPKSSHATGATGSCKTSEACCWRPYCAPAPTSSSAPSPTGSRHDNPATPRHPHPRTKDRLLLPRPDCRWSRSPPAPSAQSLGGGMASRERARSQTDRIEPAG